MRIVTALVALFVLAPTASPTPTVYTDPAESTAAVGQTLDMSVRIDAGTDTLTCFLVEFTFDPSVIELVIAEEGSLFSESGHATMFDWDQHAPGLHSCNDVTLGFDCFVMCPGELVDLEFLAVGDGATDIAITATDLRDLRRNPILPVYVSGSTVTVEPGTGVGEDFARPVLMCHPNPFGDETRLEFRSPSVREDAVAVVHDVSGRVVARRTLTLVAPGLLAGSWAGDGSSGRSVPAGVYFVEVDGPAGLARQRVTVVR